MAPEAELRAIRCAAALSEAAHIRALRIEGPGAHALLEASTTTSLRIRENQMIHTLFLDKDARPIADVYVAREEDGWLVLAEGPLPADLIAHLQGVARAHAPDAAFSIESLDALATIWSVDGPYAWEVVAALAGRAVVGMPYLSFLTAQGILCFRTGKTGEYGYLLLCPRADASAVRDRIVEGGEPLGLAPVGLSALDHCALENGYFNIRWIDTAAARDLTPLELQLQWRVTYQKSFVGADALRRRRAAGGAASRVTWFVTAAAGSGAQGAVRRPGAPNVNPTRAPAAGDRVLLGDRDVGFVLAAGPSPLRGDIVGAAVLDIALAHPGIRALHIESGAERMPIATRSPPLLNNRSLYVDPHRHSGRARDTDPFPPLVLD